MSLGMLGSLVGGLGLFMLGMKLMTDGLKFAAGNSLSTILEKWTNTTLKGIFSGALITALVQSSGAVTVAMIGFVNAGLMKLSQALMVIYGSNIGTTMTGWLVVLVGFKIDIKAFALPAVGIGMLLYLIFGGQRRGAVGEALTGFGLFFLGIDVLKVTFEGLGSSVDLQVYAGMGGLGLLVFVAIGAVITVLMQSSSASMAITLTSVAGGLIPIEGAAAMVIGANIGSTSTAVFAAIGATPSAKRVAAAHVVFNVATGLVALILLPFLLYGLARAGHLLGIDDGPVTMLALFHTVFNVLGVALMWPFTARLVNALEKRFRTPREEAVRPRYLDHTLTSTPALALDALGMELARIDLIVRGMARYAIESDEVRVGQVEADREVVNQLVNAVSEYTNQLQRTNLPEGLGGRLQHGFESSRYLADLGTLSTSVAEARAALPALDNTQLQTSLSLYRTQATEMLRAADVQTDGYTPAAAETARVGLDAKQDEIKVQILQAGTGGELTIRQMVDYLDLIRSIRRIGEQAEKAALHLSQLRVHSQEVATQALDAA